ncbi:MAG: helix-turn-helix transcriptional regulator [Terriglobia bacterium]|jgi:transcriptional regulator with XRE-family HTH domain
MQIAARIRQVRLEKSLSLGELGLKTGLSVSILDGFETGQEIPSPEMFYNLAEAMDVPFARFFYGDTDSKSTPWLSQRLSLQQLADEPPRSSSAVQLIPYELLAATRGLLSRLTKVNRGPIAKNPNPTIPPFDSQGQASNDSSEEREDSERES